MLQTKAFPALCALAFLLAMNVSASAGDPSTASATDRVDRLVSDPRAIEAVPVEVGDLDDLLARALPDPFSVLSVNDNFGAATTVSSFAFSTSGNNGADTTEAGEPLTCGTVTMGHTVWYKVIPSTTGIIYADTWGSTVDTVLAGYQGTSLATLIQKACNDDDPGMGTDSRIQFGVFAGTTYYIQLGGYFTSSGAFSLYIDNYASCSGNDNEANACIASSLPFSDAQATAGATTELGERPVAINCPAPTVNVSHTVWYEYTVPSGTPTLTASAAGSNYDTVLDVFAAGAGHSLVPVACNDNSAGPQSLVTWLGVSGTTYLIRASGSGTGFGNLAFSLS